jgi:hypothetical protein
MQNSGDSELFHAHIKERYVYNGKGHLKRQDIYNQWYTFLAFSNAESILRLF